VTAARSAAALATFPIQIDATQLFYRFFFLDPGDQKAVSTDNVQKFQLAPLSGYRFQFGSPMIADFSFAVTDKGNVEYDDDCRGFLDGFGTPNLTIKGLLVTLDALHLTGADRARPATGVVLANAQLNSDIIPTDWIAFRDDIRLLPAKGCGVIVGSALVASFTFDLKRDGTFDYDPAWDSTSINKGFLTGLGTNTLTFLGYPLTVDARGVGDLLYFREQFSYFVHR